MSFGTPNDGFAVNRRASAIKICPAGRQLRAMLEGPTIALELRREADLISTRHHGKEQRTIQQLIMGLSACVSLRTRLAKPNGNYASAQFALEPHQNFSVSKISCQSGRVCSRFSSATCAEIIVL